MYVTFQSTHELKTHQLVVKVDGWQAVSPVSMDKVGVYFRQAEPERERTSNIVSQTTSVKYGVFIQ